MRTRGISAGCSHRRGGSQRANGFGHEFHELYENSNHSCNIVPAGVFVAALRDFLGSCIDFENILELQQGVLKVVAVVIEPKGSATNFTN